MFQSLEELNPFHSGPLFEEKTCQGAVTCSLLKMSKVITSKKGYKEGKFKLLVVVLYSFQKTKWLSIPQKLDKPVWMPLHDPGYLEELPLCS